MFVEFRWLPSELTRLRGIRRHGVGRRSGGDGRQPDLPAATSSVQSMIIGHGGGSGGRAHAGVVGFGSGSSGDRECLGRDVGTSTGTAAPNEVISHGGVGAAALPLAVQHPT